MHLLQFTPQYALLT